MKILVTGGAGFIGSNFVRRTLEDAYPGLEGAEIVVLDALTYSGNLENLAPVADSPRYRFVHGDIRDAELLDRLLPGVDAIVHFAAESHVDRSVRDSGIFVETNVLGTQRLLDAALRHGTPRFVHVSTDEVFGSLGDEGFFTEETPYDPSSPYSATKAASDNLARAWNRTYGLPVLVTNCSNNYGPRQFPEKLIPHMIVRALEQKSLPVYGNGINIRDWLYVDDHAAALERIAERGASGETYLISGRSERKNIDVVMQLCAALDSARPRGDGHSYAEQIQFVTDRPGHDFRYAIDASKLERELGWTPMHDFTNGLLDTVAWYLENETWWQGILSGAYRAERIGTGSHV